MPENIGAQVVTIIYRALAGSGIVNKRQQGVIPTGIYSGGYLTKVPATNNASLSPLICEIGDGSHQVRVETLEIVTPIPVVETTKEYIILRWAYTGSTSDFMQILAIAEGEILTTDLVVGRCTFVGGSLNDFTYGDSVHPRTTPNVQDLFLKVEPTGKTGLLVRVRAGRIQTASAKINIPDYEITLGTAPTATKKIYLVYVTAAGAIAIDATGAENAVPVAPTYKGKLVLAEVTLSIGDTVVTAAEIRDVRNWITQPAVPDGTTLELDSNGKLKIKDGSVGLAQLGIISPRWSVSVCNANNYTLPAQFVSPIATFSYLSYGSFFATLSGWCAYWLFDNSVRFRMKINSVGITAKVLKLFAVDNNVYIYVDGSLVYSKIGVFVTASSPENVNLNFTNGEHTVDIVFNDQGGNAYLNILGDIVDDTNVKFVQS